MTYSVLERKDIYMVSKKGLIMEGGAMRGMFTAGVIDVLMENGIEFDGGIGVSAGAVFGCNYKSKQVGRVIRYNTRFCKNPKYCSIRSLIKTGDLYGADFCYRRIPEELDVFDYETYKTNKMEFYVVCTDAVTGKTIYKKSETGDREEIEWMRASASMPMVSNVVKIDGYHLLDGAITDSIPLKYFESIGYNKNVVILTQPMGYVKKEISLMPLMRLSLRKYPQAFKALKKRHIMYNDTIRYITEKEKSGAIFVIRPEKSLGIGHVEHKSEKLIEVYEEGRRIAEKHLEEIKNFLG